MHNFANNKRKHSILLEGNHCTGWFHIFIFHLLLDIGHCQMWISILFEKYASTLEGFIFQHLAKHLISALYVLGKWCKLKVTLMYLCESSNHLLHQIEINHAVFLVTHMNARCPWILAIQDLWQNSNKLWWDYWHNNDSNDMWTASCEAHWASKQHLDDWIQDTMLSLIVLMINGCWYYNLLTFHIGS